MLADPDLSTLPEVFDPVTLATHLRRALGGRWEATHEIQFQILKHHPGSRCTFELVSRTAKGSSALIGKVYASDRSDVYRAMEAIRHAGFGPEAEFSIPEPLAYVPELRLLLQAKVHGRRAKLIFVTDDDRARVEASERAARWLARFHAIAPRSGRIVELMQHLEPVGRWAQTIARLGEPFASQARRLSARLAGEAGSASTRERCAGHGSYDCHQIILTQSQTITFDWDSYDVTDPCRDVARFVVALQRLAVKHFGGVRALDGAVDAFLSTYRALSPCDVAKNLCWYRALTCLRLAKYEANRPVCTFPDGIEALLGEGLRVLEDFRVMRH